MQFAVVGPPAGAGRLPDKERARHGGRSKPGSRSRAGVARTLSREAEPQRFEQSGSANSLSTPAIEGVAFVTSAPIKERFPGGHAPSRCARGWRGSRRVALGAGRGQLQRPAVGAVLTARRRAAGQRRGGRGAGRREPQARPDPLRDPTHRPAQRRTVARLWRPLVPRALGSGHLTFRNRLLLGLAEGAEISSARPALLKERGIDEEQTLYRGGCEEMGIFTWLLQREIPQLSRKASKMYSFLHLASVY